MATALTWTVGLGLAVGTLMWWWWIVRGEPRVRARVARRYGVTIGTTARGHWRVMSATRSRPACLAIALLQLAYFAAAFVVWTAALVAALVLLGLTRAAG